MEIAAENQLLCEQDGDWNRSVAFQNCSYPLPLKCLGKLTMAS